MNTFFATKSILRNIYFILYIIYITGDAFNIMVNSQQIVNFNNS